MARSKARNRRSSIFPSFKNEKNEKENTQNEEKEKELPKKDDTDNDSKNLKDESSKSMVLSQEQYDAIFCGDDDDCKKDKDELNISTEQPGPSGLCKKFKENCRESSIAQDEESTEDNLTVFPSKTRLKRNLSKSTTTLSKTCQNFKPTKVDKIKFKKSSSLKRLGKRLSSGKIESAPLKSGNLEEELSKETSLIETNNNDKIDNIKTKVEKPITAKTLGVIPAMYEMWKKQRKKKLESPCKNNNKTHDSIETGDFPSRGLSQNKSTTNSDDNSFTSKVNKRMDFSFSGEKKPKRNLRQVRCKKEEDILPMDEDEKVDEPQEIHHSQADVTLDKPVTILPFWKSKRCKSKKSKFTNRKELVKQTASEIETENIEHNCNQIEANDAKSNTGNESTKSSILDKNKKNPLPAKRGRPKKKLHQRNLKSAKPEIVFIKECDELVVSNVTGPEFSKILSIERNQISEMVSPIVQNEDLESVNVKPAKKRGRKKKHRRPFTKKDDTKIIDDESSSSDKNINTDSKVNIETTSSEIVSESRVLKTDLLSNVSVLNETDITENLLLNSKSEEKHECHVESVRTTTSDEQSDNKDDILHSEDNNPSHNKNHEAKNSKIKDIFSPPKVEAQEVEKPSLMNNESSSTKNEALIANIEAPLTNNKTLSTNNEASLMNIETLLTNNETLLTNKENQLLNNKAADIIIKPENKEETSSDEEVKFTPTKPVTRTKVHRIDYRNSLNSRIDKTDSTNPYKKTYLVKGVTQDEKLRFKTPTKEIIDSSNDQTSFISNTNETSRDERTPSKPSRSCSMNVNYRETINAKIDKTDASNPYKKTYFSASSRNKKSSLTFLVAQKNTAEKTQKARVAKSLIEKAHILKKKKQLTVSPIKIAIKSESISQQRPKRQTKSNFNKSDFVYEIKRSSIKRKFEILNQEEQKLTKLKQTERKKHKTNIKDQSEFKNIISNEESALGTNSNNVSSSKFNEKENTTLIEQQTIDSRSEEIVIQNHEDCSKQSEDEGSQTKDNSISIEDNALSMGSCSPLKKKARIKLASEYDSPEKKKVKIKNSTPDKQFLPATFGDVNLFSNSTFLNKKKEQDFKELSDLFNDISKEDETAETNTLNNIQLNDQPAVDSQQDLESFSHSNQSTNDVDKSSSSDTKILTLSYLKLKVVKLKYGQSDEFKFVDFDNRIITFCGECAHCQRKEDCGKCRHCRNYKIHATRNLPCWLRRCLRPIYGKKLEIKKKREPTQSNQTQPKLINNKETAKVPVKEPVSVNLSNKQKIVDKTPEKVELSVISDNSQIKTKGDPNEPLQFKVNVKKAQNGQFKPDFTSPTGRMNVFTGMSPMKPKLRSSMNELIKKSVGITSKKLPQIEYSTEHLVKLPWPNDSNEDAAWVSGHHICLISELGSSYFPSLCFLCGSAGQEKMVTCNSCCEMFHTYCLDFEPIDWKDWHCDRCKRCTVCGYKENLLMCDRCHDCYHAECLGPFYQRDTEGAEETWVCGKCVKCKKCERRTAGKLKSSRWMYGFSMCEQCGQNWKRKNYCPICEVLYQEDDDSLKMMFCSECERWIHMECEGITNDDYEILADLPDNIPYVCKLCTKTNTKETSWYKEVQEELYNGFLKVYYDLISHKDYKQIKNNLSIDLQSTNVECLHQFDNIFKSIEEREFGTVEEFHQISVAAITKMQEALKDETPIDISYGYIPDISALLPLFLKSLKTKFSWFDTECSDKKADSSISEIPNLQIDENKSDLDEETISLADEEALKLDHMYLETVKDTPKQSEDNIDKDVETVQKKDIRKCLFCSIRGDQAKDSAGRLLYVGLDDWVHINCALWSAEVYEDDSGRLKNVNEALKRGNKLKCEFCGRYGASIGCCFLKCSKSYHFVCAKESNSVFQDDKKMYCIDHKAKANKSLVLSEKEFSVERRVLVDLVRFKSIKRIQRGINPKSVTVLCGSHQLSSLGYLADESDSKHYLMPVGYRITRLFWSTNNAREKCKYVCEIQSKGKKIQEEVKEETKDSQLDNMTYCHDKSEWEGLLQKTDCLCDLKKLEEGSVKRKLYQGKCEECLRNQNFLFTTNYKDISKLINGILRSLKRKQLKKTSNNEKKKKVKNKKTKKAGVKGAIPIEDQSLKNKPLVKNLMKSTTVSSVTTCVDSTKSFLTSQTLRKGREVIISAENFTKAKPVPTTTVTPKTYTNTSILRPISNSIVTMETKPVKPIIKTTDRALTISNLQSTSQIQMLPNKSLNVINFPKKHHHSPRKCMNLSSTKPFDVIDSRTDQLKDLLQKSRHQPQLIYNSSSITKNPATFPNKTSPVKITSVSPSKQIFDTSTMNSLKESQVFFAKNLQFTSQTNDKIKQQLILPKPTSFNRPVLPIASNPLKPINLTKTHDSAVDCKQINNHFKKELLLVQVREYLRKHPDAVNYSPPPPTTSQAPCIYLSNNFPQQQHKPTTSLVAFRAMLPEHLWMDLINAGIAQHELEKIVIDSNAAKQKMVVKTYNADLTSTTNVQSLVNAFQTTINKAQVNNVTKVLHPPSETNSTTINSLNCSIQALQKIKANLLFKTNTNTNFQESSLQITPITQQERFIIGGTSHTMHASTASNTNPSNIVKLQLREKGPAEHFMKSYYNQLVSRSELTSGTSMVALPVNASNQSTKQWVTSTSTMQNVFGAQQQHLAKRMFTSKPLSNSSPVHIPTITTTASPKKKNKRIKLPSQSDDEPSPQKKVPSQPAITVKCHQALGKTQPSAPVVGYRPLRGKTKSSEPKTTIGTTNQQAKGKIQQVFETCLDNEVDLNSIIGNEFIERHFDLIDDEDCFQEEKKNKKRRNYLQMLNEFFADEAKKEREEEDTNLLFVVTNEDGLKIESSSLKDIWKKLLRQINDKRTDVNMKTLPFDLNDAYEMFGFSKDFITYLTEQLPGGHKCRTYKFQHHLPSINDDDENLPENQSGCARSEIVVKTAEKDMFAWLSSTYRIPPKQEEDNQDDDLLGGQDLPTAMKYRFLKNTAKDHVGVYRSPIQGRGLFCKKTIEEGDMIIEYSGETIRSVLTDKREDYYEKKGYGCYMFRIDSMDVVDATMKGNAARFINHSCDPNCFSRIIHVDGSKKIIIFASRRINVGEELTYDYKFAQEDDKLPCFCGSKKCRTYLN